MDEEEKLRREEERRARAFKRAKRIKKEGGRYGKKVGGEVAGRGGQILGTGAGTVLGAGAGAVVGLPGALVTGGGSILAGAQAGAQIGGRAGGTAGYLGAKYGVGQPIGKQLGQAPLRPNVARRRRQLNQAQQARAEHAAAQQERGDSDEPIGVRFTRRLIGMGGRFAFGLASFTVGQVIFWLGPFIILGILGMSIITILISVVVTVLNSS